MKIFFPIILFVSTYASLRQDSYPRARMFDFKINISKVNYRTDSITSNKKKSKNYMGRINPFIRSTPLKGREKENPDKLKLKNPFFDYKDQNTVMVKLNLYVYVHIIKSGFDNICYKTKVAIMYNAKNLAINFDGYELQLKTMEPKRSFDLSTNMTTKMIDEYNQEYYVAGGLSNLGLALFLNKGLRSKEIIFLSSNNPGACH